jgi:hypothetical protein
MMAQGQSGQTGELTSSHPLKARPCIHLVLARNLEVIAASDGYLEITQIPRLRAPQTSVLQLLPDPVVPGSSLSLATLKASLDRVLRATAADNVAFTSTIPASAVSQTSSSETAGLATAPPHESTEASRTWVMTNTPMLDGHGAVMFILHSLSDVTTVTQPYWQPARIAQTNDALRTEEPSAAAESLILQDR